MEVADASETLVSIHQTSWRHIPENIRRGDSPSSQCNSGHNIRSYTGGISAVSEHGNEWESASPEISLLLCDAV
jgi:hypothetical protein